MSTPPPRPGTPSPALAGLALLLGCQLAGELIARATGLPWPGPVPGLLLLLALLAAGLWRQPIGAACDVLLAHLWLLFVPVGVGVITHLDAVARHGLALAAVFAVLTGLIGAVTAPYLFDALRVTSPAVRGFALGTASHGIGAARALQVHPEAGAHAGLAFALQALMAALLLPLAMRWL